MTTTQEDVMLACEAMEWIDRSHKAVPGNAGDWSVKEGRRQWLAGILADIERRRGQASAEKLRQAIKDELKRRHEAAMEGKT